MVDIGVTGPTHFAARPSGALSESVVDLRPVDDIALSDYESFCRNAVYAPAQHPLWLRCWVTATGADAFIMTLRRDEQPAIALALEVVREGPFRIARFPGGQHANGNFIATLRGAPPLSEHESRLIAAALHDARPDIDLISLERQNPLQGGLANPFSELASLRSPNVSLAVDLAGGFEATLSRRNGKRKRKKLRQQLRKFEAAGGGQRVMTAATPEDAERLIDAFFVMKAARFREKGIADVFAAVEVQAFFRALFLAALDEATPSFILHGLEVGGELVAINGCSVTPTSVVCEFGSILDTGDNSSPGFFLDFACIEEACDAGKALYDFSVGDEAYKRSWCDVETVQFDTLLPLTARGRAAWALEMARAHAVRLVKSNGALWSFVQLLRTKVAGGRSPRDD